MTLQETAKTPHESNQQPNHQIRRPVCGEKEEFEKRTEFGRDTPNQEKHDEVIDPTSTWRPVCGQESTERCVLAPKHVEEDRTGTGRPVLVDQKEEHKIDFRVSGLSRAVVEAEHLRVQELVNGIENHVHREALHAYLQQNNVYNPFSKNSKEMIRELGNVELFEFCETTPKAHNGPNVFFIGIKELCNTFFLLSSISWAKPSVHNESILAENKETVGRIQNCCGIKTRHDRRSPTAIDKATLLPNTPETETEAKM